ncbi:MAG: ABC transporter ATP-binding protein [Bacteroidales bacterium]|nr:ABC transporter ATP-binding protein [Bacteroidales bacterium]
MSDILLSVKNLNICFGEKSVLKDFSYELKRGQVLGIVGESGSGKTLSSLALLKLLPKNAQVKSGESMFFDSFTEKYVDLITLSESEIRKYRGRHISMIFQEPMSSLNPSKKCGIQVTEMIQLHLSLSSKQARQKVLDLFEEVKLPSPEEVFNKYPYELSGGQQQRVMIAMAISCEPQILIADEPTTALDVTIQKEILLLLKSLQQKLGISIIFISHDLDVVSSIATDILVLRNGKIMEHGTAQHIMNNAQSDYTKGLVACKPNRKFRAIPLPTVADFINKVDLELNIEKAEDRNKRHSKIYANKPILTIRNMNLWFGKSSFFGKSVNRKQILTGVNFELYKGETLGLVGESGSGKTTIGRSLMNLLNYSADEFTIGNRNISDYSLKELRRKVQIVFQDPYSSLNPKKTVGNAIMEPLIVHTNKNKEQCKVEVLELLERVGLPKESFGKYPHEFSGGQRQRIGIARSLILKPEILICDESVSALDVSVQAQILNILTELKQKFELTYVFISHDMSVVKYFSDRIMVLNSGSVEEIKEADALFNAPATDYTKKLISSII